MASTSVPIRRLGPGAILLIAGLSSALPAWAQEPEACPRCGWSPPATAAKVTVSTVAALRRAVGRAAPGSTILLEDGIYHLGGATLDLAARGLVLRGKGGQRSKVLIQGRGMAERMVAITVSAPDVAIADLTISQVGFHGIQVKGERGAHRVAIHHVHILDVGQQLIKGSRAADSNPCRDGLVACSTLEYTDSAPSDYTNGVDVLNGENWLVRDNTLRRIRGPRSQGYRAGPAILFWGGSSGTVVERNLVVDCYRGIALGLTRTQAGTRDGLDHRGGIIRRNAVSNLDSWADEGIEVNTSPGTLVEHNTVLVEGKVPWSISIRFPTAGARVRNNLSNHRVILRDGARAELTANIVGARLDWFIDPRRGDLRLAREGLPAVDAGIADPPAVAKEKGGETPFSGKAPDAGAYEFRGAH